MFLSLAAASACTQVRFVTDLLNESKLSTSKSAACWSLAEVFPLPSYRLAKTSPMPIQHSMLCYRTKSSSMSTTTTGLYEKCCASPRAAGAFCCFAPIAGIPSRRTATIGRASITLQFAADQLLPKPWRDRLAPHVRAYTSAELTRLLDFDCGLIVHHSRIYGGYDNIITRVGSPAIVVRDLLHRLEGTVLDTWALSHFVVVQKR